MLTGPGRAKAAFRTEGRCSEAAHPESAVVAGPTPPGFPRRACEVREAVGRYERRLRGIVPRKRKRPSPGVRPLWRVAEGLDRVFRSGPDNNFGVLVEAVTLAADGAYSVGEAAQFGAEAADVDVDGALVGHFLGVAPQTLEQFIAADRTGAVFHQVIQEFEFLEGQVQGFAVQVDFAAGKVDQDAGRMRVLGLLQPGSLAALLCIHGGVTEGGTDDVERGTRGASRGHGHGRVAFGTGHE